MEGEKGSPGSSTADGPRTEADKFQPLPTDWWDDESDDDVSVGRDRREVDATDRQGSTQGPHPAEEQRRAEQTIETASGKHCRRHSGPFAKNKEHALLANTIDNPVREPLPSP